MASQVIFTVAISMLTAVIAAWLTAWLALRRFYSETLWRRKTEAYTAIFEALHGLRVWHDKQFLLSLGDRELDQEEAAELRNSYRAAKRALELRLAGESWLLPDYVRDRLVLMTAVLDKPQTDWVTYIDEGFAAVASATDELLQLVREDLGIQRRQGLGMRLRKQR